MIAILSRKVSSYFLSQGIITSEEEEIYTYSCEILFSILCSISILIGTAIFSGQYLPVLLFSFSFALIRLSAGGYHADSHQNCQFILIAVCMSFIFSLFFFSEQALVLWTRIGALVSCLIIGILSPVEDHNRPFTQKEKQIFKFRSRLISFILTGIILLLSHCQGIQEAAYSLAFGEITVAFSLVAMILKKHWILKDLDINDSSYH